MKIFIFTLSLLVHFACLSFAQPQSKLSFSLIKEMQKEIHAINNISVFVKGDIEAISALTLAHGGIFKYAAGDIAAIRIPVSSLEAFFEHKAIVRIEDQPMNFQVLNDQMLINNNVWPVRLGQGPLNGIAYTGKNVVMGIIDTGIDFSHPDFKDSNGKSRIKYIWDHLLADSINTPLPYNYGQEFSASDIDSGRATSHQDQSGHGTHVAGIAAGNGIAMNNYSGVATEADIIAVSLNFSQPDNTWLSSVADGVKYIYDKAVLAGKPCVINISAGTYFGSHDGLDLQAQAIDNLIAQQPGRSLVCAAGNAGESYCHLQYQVSNDSSFTWFSRPSGSIYIEMWSDTASFNNLVFAIGADKKTPNYDYRGRLPFSGISAHLGILKKDTLYSDGNRLGIIESYGQLIGGTYSMAFNIIPDSAYNWRLITNGSGTFDLWSFDMVYAGLPTAAVFPDIARYKMPDLNQTIVSSFTCSDKVVAVGEYINRDHYTDANGTVQTFPFVVGSHTPSSSRGPTRDGRIKPDISSTGLATLSCAVLADVPWFLANAPNKLAAGAKHIRDGGTSSASPVVAGIAALYLEKNPNATAAAVKSALLNCTKTDAHTGGNLPDNTWGYGKVDAFATLTGCAAGLIDSDFSGDDRLFCYPNPTTNESIITFNFTERNQAKEVWIKIVDAFGRQVRFIEIEAHKNTYRFVKDELKGGVYFYSLVLDGQIKATKKLMVN